MSNQKQCSTREGLDDITPIPVERRMILHPSALTASDPKLTICGALNPGVLELNHKKLIVVRVDEILTEDQVASTVSEYGGNSAVPYIELETRSVIAVPTVRPPHYDPDEDYLRTPTSFLRNERPFRPRLYLSYLAHLRFFDISTTEDLLTERGRLAPSDVNDQFGCEDARLAGVAGKMTVTYNGLGHCGSTVHQCFLGEDGSTHTRKLLLPPDHKHGCPFPERVSDEFLMLARPLVRMQIQDSGIWLYGSPDGVHWRPHSSLLNPRPSEWDNARVGPGTPPVLTDCGWLIFYYGVDQDKSYHVGAALLDRKDPSTVRARSQQPIFSPTHEWERMGRRADAVFPSGLYLERSQDVIHIYYGAADTCVGKATLGLAELLDYLTHQE